MLCVVFIFFNYFVFSQITEKARLFNLHNNYAIYHYAFKNYDSALIHLNQAEKIAPLLEIGLVLKAKNYAGLKKENECAEYIHKYCLADPYMMWLGGFQDSLFSSYINASDKCKKIINNSAYYKKMYYKKVDLDILEKTTELYYSDQLCRYPNALNLDDTLQKKYFLNK